MSDAPVPPARPGRVTARPLPVPLRLPAAPDVWARLRMPAGGSPRAVVQVVHGMAEHSGRYTELADALVDTGFAVVLSDHRGHGRSRGTRFHYADTDGWRVVLGDLLALRAAAATHTQDAPHVLLGHSLGSFLVRDLVARGLATPSPGEPRTSQPLPGATQHAAPVAAVILSGTGGGLSLRDRIGLAGARRQVNRQGPQHIATSMTQLAFTSFNRSIGPGQAQVQAQHAGQAGSGDAQPSPADDGRTGFEWLSRDEAAVTAYVADPACGGPVTAQFFVDMLTGIEHAVAGTSRWPVGLRTLIISGDRDPVGHRGKDPAQLYAALARAGVKDVTLQLYAGARHELLHETPDVRTKALADVIGWLGARFPRR